MAHKASKKGGTSSSDSTVTDAASNAGKDGKRIRNPTEKAQQLQNERAKKKAKKNGPKLPTAAKTPASVKPATATTVPATATGPENTTTTQAVSPEDLQTDVMGGTSTITGSGTDQDLQTNVGGTSPATDNDSIAASQMGSEQGNATNLESKYSTMMGNNTAYGTPSDVYARKVHEDDDDTDKSQARRWTEDYHDKVEKMKGQKSDEHPSQVDELSVVKLRLDDCQRSLVAVERKVNTKIDAEAMGDLVMNSISVLQNAVTEIGKDMDIQNNKIVTISDQNKKFNEEIKMNTSVSNISAETVQSMVNDTDKKLADMATNINALTTAVNDPTTGLAALGVAVNNAATGLTVLGGAVNDPSTGLAALGVTVNDPATGLAALGVAVNDPDSGLRTLTNNNTTQIATLATAVNDPTTGLAAKLEAHALRIATLESEHADREASKQDLEDSKTNLNMAKKDLNHAWKLVSGNEVVTILERVEPLMEIVKPLLEDGKLAKLTDFLKPETVDLMEKLNPLLQPLQKLVGAAGVEQTVNFLSSLEPERMQKFTQQFQDVESKLNGIQALDVVLKSLHQTTGAMLGYKEGQQEQNATHSE